MRILLIILLACISFSCKSNKTQEKKIITKKIKTVAVDKKCLSQSDSLEVKKIIESIINNIENDNVKSLSNKFTYPISMFNFKFNNPNSFIQQWNKSDELKNYFSLKIYDENDEYIGKSESANIRIIFFPSDKKQDCFIVQFGLGSGLIFNLDRIKKEIKIVNLDTVD